MGHKKYNPEESISCLTRERNLVLIGYRATGKSAVGSRLAQRLARPFVDLDQVLEAEMGRSITDLVAAEGWAEFRRREKEVVARCGRACGQVLATGGGAVLDPENVEILRQNGVVVWLRADPATIQERLSRDQREVSQRPSLTGRSTLEEVAEVLQTRQPLYAAAAQIVIDTDRHSLEQVVEQVLAAVEGLAKKA
ncbi:MAG: shikimate kinase AroL [Desulfobaccales bacterium]